MLRGLLKGTLQKMNQLFNPEDSRQALMKPTFLALLELIRAARIKVEDEGQLNLDRTQPQKQGGFPPMNQQQKIGALEAMLFAHADPVEAARLADALRVQPEEVVRLFKKLQKKAGRRGKRHGDSLLRPRPLADWPPARITARWSSASWTPAAMHRFRPPRWRCCQSIADNRPALPQLY